MSIRTALLLHGAGGGGWEWNVWREVFAAGHIDAHAPDLQPSVAGLAATSFADYIAQVRAALSDLSRPRAVVGASMGGLLALQVASEADALVLVNPLPPRPWHARLPLQEWPAVVRWHGDARLASTRAALPDADPVTAMYAFRHWRDESGRVLREAHAGIDTDTPLVPTLCVISGQDRDVPAEMSEAFMDQLAATRIGLPEASHVGPLLGRQASAVAAQVVAWLSAR